MDSIITTGPCRRQQQNSCFSSQLIHSLPEFNPPSSMPHGNVGTSLRIFRELIRSCRLPPSVIKKLRLVFPTSLKRYGAVPLDYATETRGISLSEMRKREGHTIKSTSSRKKRKIVKEDQIEEDEGKQEEEEDEEQNVCYCSTGYPTNFANFFFNRSMMTMVQRTGKGMKHYTMMLTNK